MTPELVLDVVQQALVTGVWVLAPLLGAGMAVGLGIAVLQAATQIQESSLNFVPKVVAIGAVIAATGPWLLSKLVTFAVAMLTLLQNIAPGSAG